MTMEQEVEESQTVRNLAEFAEVFLYAAVFAFALEGLLLICVLIYSLFFYRFVAWIQWHELIGMFVTYTIFTVILLIMLHFIHKTIHFSNHSVLRGFSGAMALYSIVFPITPLSWYNDRYTTIGPSTGFSYGVEYQLWPLLSLVGFAALSVLVMDFRSSDDSKSYTSMLLFSGILAVLVTTVSMLVLSVPPDTGHIDNWATPFYILPHVTGLVLLLESVRQYIGTRNR